MCVFSPGFQLQEIIKLTIITQENEQQRGYIWLWDGETRCDLCLNGVSVDSTAINRTSLKVNLAAAVWVEGI